MSETNTPAADVSAPSTPTPSPRTGGATLSQAVVAVVGLIALLALGLAWQSQQRLKQAEQELVRRQDSSQSDANIARDQSRQAQELARDTAAKVALLDAKLAEVALQREQLETLIQSMTRSRDENVVGDIEASLRVAMQQSAITGSAEPLVSALRQADDRLARYHQPRLEGVRRAVVRDLDRIKAVSVVDVSTLTIKLDEVARQVDDLPLLAVSQPGLDTPRAPATAGRGARPAAAAAPAPSAPLDPNAGWWERVWHGAGDKWDQLSSDVWREARGLLRVTRIDHPEAALMAPEQMFFLRENLKLRLLNARLALLSRQFDTAQNDLREAQGMLERYFDDRSRKLAITTELLRQVQGQARQVQVPRPDDTLAALSAVAR
ncbi:uroporphyrinogen-III C-methyltransferase [Roseateles depolymerans]|uniref:Uroporphyrin-III methyltransferase n=1 Tax=Roseateles depolymerans TaxID=76731 RepID=A0A0U3MHN0_9BURK|nr:uroporphyrinogen-III C-methyltransferase [Roseateles depolymerans]ALV08173.1 uroporphyrin-III methyltransferase [Roseateles depolymerans]REG21603.1 uroporphyrin-3 C-methyltransferase [Roseateles depolymerans]